MMCKLCVCLIFIALAFVFGFIGNIVTVSAQDGVITDADWQDDKIWNLTTLSFWLWFFGFLLIVCFIDVVCHGCNNAIRRKFDNMCLACFGIDPNERYAQLELSPLPAHEIQPENTKEQTVNVV